MVSFAEGISIAELCVYIPILILTLIIIFRHGFQRQLGWIYLSIFCLIRLIGAGFKISSVHNPANKTDTEWAAILNSVGLSPLLMASLGLLKRITDQCSTHVRSNSNILPVGGIIGKLVTSKATANSRRSRIIQVAQLPTMIALILCIAGGTDAASSSTSEQQSGTKDTKAGVIIFCIVYILLAFLAIITVTDVRKAERGEKRIYIAVMAALPFIAIRLLWSVISAFSHSKDFSVVNGKPVIQLVMATLEEFVVVVMYTVAGLTVGRPV